MVNEKRSGSRSAHFGVFSLDLRTLALSRHGRPVDLATLPVRVLSYLVAREGEIVTRAELRREFWGEGMVLGFDDRLNTCVATIRSALDDEASSPTYIETVRGRGYRFIAPVTIVAAPRRSAFPARAARPMRAAALAVIAAFTVTALSVSGDTRSIESRTSIAPIDPLAPRTTDDPEAWSLYMQATALVRNMREADYRAAVQLLERAIELDPEFALGHARLAVARVNLAWLFADLDAAEKYEMAAERAVALAPDLAETWFALGLVRYYGGRRYDEALDALRRAERIDPGDPEVVSTIGWVLRRQGRWEESTDYLERAITIDPHSMEIHRSLGQSHLRLRNYTVARRHLGIALSMSPTDASRYIELAELALLSGEGPDAAYRILVEGAERTSASLEALALAHPVLGRVLGARMGARIVAVGHVDEPRDDIGDAGRTQLALAWLKSRTGDHGAAERIYASVREQLRARNPDDRQHRLSEERANLAFAAAGLGLRDETLHHVGIVLEEFGSDWDAMHSGLLRLRAAEALALVGEHDGALELLTELLESPAPISRASLSVDPIWDPLRDDPRFRALLDGSTSARSG